jgi:hypothetical protein
MTHEEFYSAAFLASLPIAAQLYPAKTDIVKEAHNMALEAVTYWQEQLQDIHRHEARSDQPFRSNK